jgi:hypothetical protein
LGPRPTEIPELVNQGAGFASGNLVDFEERQSPGGSVINMAASSLLGASANAPALLVAATTADTLAADSQRSLVATAS